jgi:hypothetical protein
MKRNMLNLISLTALVFGLLLSPGWVLAGSRVFDLGPDSCTGTNCNATTINGTYIFDTTNGANNSDPFEIQIFSRGSECVRLDLTTSFNGVDFEMVLVSPDGTVWRNDDRSTSLNPLIKANTFARGWYTLQVSQFAAGSSSGDFTVRYGRYLSGNVNCSGATPPFAPSTEQPKTAAPEPAGPTSGNPTSAQ